MTASRRKPTRQEVWNWFGPPHDQVGSVNDPRSFEEYGVRWNEKWVYCSEDGREVERVVLWNRYDFRGAFRVKPDGSADRDPLPDS